MSYDLIEAVLARPSMYTVSGTYGEVVSFLEGYYSGLAKHSPEVIPVVNWSEFRQWLVIKLGNPKTPELKILYQEYGDNSLEMFASFYHEFKSKKTA